ncbi:MAG TPA: glutamine synthetase III [Candidatus Pullichristensenella excrementigallinarum]|uniref:Glutamine synthetase III n=1 Tax=Candidatus Pullichristensenella excrementigallinarum TaxID=2840907 RepID=A0A9D1LCY6_9FIRM|nr:glutamine synthetase III [Candidatus Pullichristensenella excrementigallinarum]
MVFNDSVMRARLPRATFEALQKTIREGLELDRNIADVVANAMKDWALEKGATHFTHWFQPMTGITAEKHDAFLTPVNESSMIAEFSGKELIKGEPDASSFPSGGLRATFEARGYTAWDPTSYAFIKDNTLCIPTAFCSYTGNVLDKKTPLLRSAEALSTQARRILKLFGHEDVKRVFATVGPEQEYFLIDQKVFEKRPDLRYAGRTLFGARPSKGQELEDQYFGALKTRISEFMRDLDEELWKLGVFARTEHNEVAPAQHELAPVFTNVNVATDHNQLTMEMMKKVAAKHGLACLLHEKPFAGVNGSGKHNNWSMSTDTGVNLLDPGKSPAENVQFLLFLVAVIRAVDDYQDLLRISTASAGNDHRLGASEAPPAIVSMFLGDELSGILDAVMHKENYLGAGKTYMETGLGILPKFRKDTTDRNRTSPFAFTGNKFEFRMVGSSHSIADANTMLNTMVADALRAFADELENAEDLKVAVGKLIRRTLREHSRIIFNGNNYSEDWVAEAEKRGLCNYRSSVDAIEHLADEKNTALFERMGIFTAQEVRSREDIMLENYVKVIHIEALTMLDMVRRDILPAVVKFTSGLGESALRKKELGVKGEYEKKMVGNLSALTDSIASLADALDQAVIDAPEGKGALPLAQYYRDSVFPAMQELRCVVDETELLVAKDVWPYPSYGQMLFSVL